MPALKDIKNVLVGLTEEGQQGETSDAIGYGLSLSVTAGAHLTVQAASRRLVMNSALAGSFGRALVTEENGRTAGLSQAVAEKVRGDAASAGVGCTVESPQLTHPDILATFAAKARLHDLIILDAEERTIDLDRELIEVALFGSGRPVIVVPAGHNAFAGRRIVIAWDGGTHAARAVNDALPFLRAAEAVEIISVVGEKDLSSSVAGAELAPHLARHGIAVTVDDLPLRPDGDIAETLRDAASRYRAEMLVMGAYRHGPIRQWIFGGLTQSLMTACPIPLLLAH
ncbi:universal stress protein [Methylobacterium sp. Leaf117]|uniref:universal stress protein n=1 Tax=Methylobacterium sp. Leaf117 TaxID=1736260 RepID=UPI0006FB2D39|nr:universal stress protein [Methylobacterium sp. Leaf117]KQP77495.1 universal stress protein UspA [Methylobacterium sp. Leaf117]